MAIDAVLVGARGTSTGSSVSTTGGSVTTGDTLVAVISYDPGATISSIADTAGNTYTLAANNTGGSGRLALYYCQNATGNASNVLTVNFSATAFPTAHLIKVTGAAAASFDGASLVSSSAAQTPPWTSTSNTLAQAASCVIACTEGNANGSNGAYSVSGGTFSLLSSEPDATTFWTSGVAKSVVASTSAVTATWSKTGEGSTIARGSIIVAFKEATGGGGALNGTIASSFTATGTLTGTGALSGTVAAAFSTAQTQISVPRVVRSRAYPLAVPNRQEGQIKRRVSYGALRAHPVGSVAADIVLAETFTPAVNANAMTGTIAAAFATSATLTGTGALAGTIAPAFATSGTLRNLQPISGTIASSFTTSGTLTAATTVGHAIGYEFLGSSGASTPTASFTTQATGSALLVSVGRGDDADFSASAVTDNKGNTFALLNGSNTYTNFTSSGTALYGDLTAAGGSGHIVTHTFTTVNDEATVVAVEVPGVNAIVDLKWNQNNTTVTDVAPTTSTSLSVTTQSAAKLVAFWWGDNPSGELGPPAASSGWTALDWTSSLASNHVQSASYYREVSSAGTYSITLTPNRPQGAQVYIVALVQANAISGTIAPAFNVTGTLTGTGALSGTVAPTFAVTGTLTSAGSGALSGTIASSFTASATLTGTGALTGTVPATFATTASLTGTGALSGTIASTFAASGTLTSAGSGALNGTASAAFGVSATLTGTGALTGTVPATFAVTGSLSGIRQITGTVASTFGTTGTLVGIGALTGSVAATFSTTGTLTGRGALSGLAAMTFNVSGNLADPQAVVTGVPEARLKARRIGALVAAQDTRTAKAARNPRTLH